MLHEGLGSVGLWRDVPERLAASIGWGVFAYSRFGYGRSDPTTLPRPMTYMHHEAQEVLPEVLEAAGIGRWVLVGHSDGGSIAAIHAGRSGSPRGRLVLIAAHFFVEDLNIASNPRDPARTTTQAACARAWPATTATSTSRSAAGTTLGSIRISAFRH